MLCSCVSDVRRVLNDELREAEYNINQTNIEARAALIETSQQMSRIVNLYSINTLEINNYVECRIFSHRDSFSLEYKQRGLQYIESLRHRFNNRTFNAFETWNETLQRPFPFRRFRTEQACENYRGLIPRVPPEQTEILYAKVDNAYRANLLYIISRRKLITHNFLL
ncbi:hypothetical protein MN116_008059 [Schistosoma mekongi]|uniref:Uncharacterized protein n=1 Tax=Schistosoma mekongi TaxID=38744 RepID=A0AAE1Z8K3_SCHME|nr:hypothetical protein MN116_008059 [Schistosoma mekongi]